MKRSDAFSHYVEGSTQNRDCVVHESRGEFSHEQCLAVKELATILDDYDITIKYGYVITPFI